MRSPATAAQQRLIKFLLLLAGYCDATGWGVDLTRKEVDDGDQRHWRL